MTAITTSSRSLLLSFLQLGLLPLLLAATPASASVHKISNDLYAYISENDSSANSTFLVTSDGILVVDTGLNEQEGRKLLTEIRKISVLPVRYIVNTHFHPDHIGGNSVVGPGATFISNELKSQDRAFTYSAAGTRISFPARARFRLGGHEVEVFFPGPAHTMRDAVVYFPEERAISTGDLFLNGSCPAMDEGDLENWIDALDEMLKMPVDTFVPGHFEIGGKEPLQHFRNYLAELRSQVARLFHSGVSLEEMQTRLDLHQYRDLRQFPQYEATFADNAAAYYHQLQQRSRGAAGHVDPAIHRD